METLRSNKKLVWLLLIGNLAFIYFVPFLLTRETIKALKELKLENVEIKNKKNQIEVLLNFNQKYRKEIDLKKEIENYRKEIKEIKSKLSQEFPQKEGENLAQVLQEKKKKLEKLSGEILELTSRENSLEKVYSFLALAKEPVKFISKIETTFEELKISNFEILASSPEEEKRFKKLKFSIETKGKFPQLATFIEKLESLPYLIEIENLAITKKEEKKEKSEAFPAMKLDIQLYAY